MTLRWRLIQLVLAAAVPGVLLAGLATWISYRDQLETAKLNLVHTTRAIAFAYDSELSDAITLTQGLARASSLRSGDFAAFYDRAREALPGTPQQGYWLVLNRADTGEQVLNTRQPLGVVAAYPAEEARAWVADVARTRQPHVGNLRLAFDKSRYVATVQVPVMRGDTIDYVLSYVFDTAHMQRKLDQQHLPADWLLSMFDRAGQRVVRTLDPSKFVMRPPAPSLQKFMAETEEGVTWTTSAEGAPFLTAIARGPLSGWTVALGVRTRTILAPVYQSALWTFFGGFAVTLFAVLIASQLARRIAAPMERLSRAAADLAYGDIEQPPPSGIREIDRASTGLAEAAANLRRRTEERDRNVEALRELNATLESRVVRRTDELAAANRVLSEEIEQRKRLEEALVHSQKLEAVGQLTGGIAHEFNNILAAVIACFRLIEKRAEGQTRDLAARGREAGERGAKLIQQLLAFSRKQSLSAEPVDLNGVVTRMSELMHQMTDARMRITVETYPDLWLAMADPQQIELCLVNLIFNARDAMPGGGEVRIRTSNVVLRGGDEGDDVPAGQYVAIEVRDDGTGMNDQTLRRAFEPFFTTKEPGKGTGLGLSMVYGTAHQLGGTVRLASLPGQGTVATILIPRATVAGEWPAAQSVPPAGRKRHGVKLLLTDDDDDVRRFTAETLAELGYQVIEASSGASGLQLIEKNRDLDLLIVDLAMPGMSGLDMIERCRAMRPHLPIVVFTGYAEISVALGEVVVVHKPATGDALAEAIEQSLARRDAEFAAAAAG